MTKIDGVRELEVSEDDRMVCVALQFDRAIVDRVEFKFSLDSKDAGFSCWTEPMWVIGDEEGRAVIRIMTRRSVKFKYRVFLKWRQQPQILLYQFLKRTERLA